MLKLRDNENEGQTIGIVCHIGTMNRFNYLSDPAHFHFINYPNADATEFDLDVLAKNSEQYLAKQHIH